MSLSSSLDLASMPAECACCAAKKLSIIRLKRFNAITIGCVCLLGLSGLGLSAYLIYKYLKLKKKMNDFESLVENFSMKLQYSDKEVKTRKSSLVEKYKDDSKLEKTTWIQKEVKLNARSVSFESDLDENYETPQSFLSRAQSAEQLNVQKESFESKNYDFMQLDDNRSLELMQMQTDENKRLLCSNYKEKYEKNPTNLNDSIDFIKSLYVLADAQPDNSEKKILNYDAYNLAKICLDLHTDSYLAQKWFAMTTSRIIDYLSINEKVKSGFEFKEHLDIAISINQTDYLLYYLRGRWFFKMCNLSWAEKYGVRLVFGKIPDISIENAYQDFIQAEKLHKKKSKGNLLHLAKCLINKNDLVPALEYLNIAITLPVKNSEHEAFNQEIMALIKKYSK